MKSFIPIIIVCLLSLLCFSEGFGQEQTLIKQKIETLEKQLMQNTETLNIPLANQLIQQYKAYSFQFKADTTSASYLMKAADISRGIGKCSQSIVLLEKAKMNYPKVKETENILFLQGYIFENCLQDVPKAKQKYEAFIQKYPNHRLTTIAKTSLQYLGKSPAELLKLIEKQ